MSCVLQTAYTDVTMALHRTWNAASLKNKKSALCITHNADTILNLFYYEKLFMFFVCHFLAFP